MLQSTVHKCFLNCSHPLTWFAKPIDLSPLMCAMYGWKNIDKDILQCVNCKVFLSGELSKPTDATLYRESCNALKKNLVVSHDRLCKWQLNPCPDSLVNIPCHDREELLKQFQKRSTSLQHSSIPNINYNTMENYDMTEEKLLNLVRDLHEHDTSNDDRSSMVDICALCGWCTSESLKDVLKCEYCQRKIGLWNFCKETNIDSEDTKKRETNISLDSVVCDQTEENLGDAVNNETDTKEKSDECTNITEVVNESDNCDKRKRGEDNEGNIIDDTTVPGGARTKKQKVEKNSFDPISEHRYWCPWLQTDHKYSTKILQCYSNVAPLKSTTEQYDGDKSPKTTYKNYTSDPAWLLATKILGQSVADSDCMQMKQSPQSEGLRHLRRILQQCTSHRSQQNMKSK
ncbi:Nuclear-interacting partner of ALK [Mactra antiquata]